MLKVNQISHHRAFDMVELAYRHGYGVCHATVGARVWPLLITLWAQAGGICAKGLSPVAPALQIEAELGRRACSWAQSFKTLIQHACWM